MRVEVGGCRKPAVPKGGLYDLEVDAVGEEVGRSRVPQIMDAKAPDPGLVTDCLPFPVDVPGFERRTDRCGEDEACVFPNPGCQTLGVLCLPALLKCIDDEVRQGKG